MGDANGTITLYLGAATKYAGKYSSTEEYAMRSTYRGLYPIVTSQYSSTTLYQFSCRIQ